MAKKAGREISRETRKIDRDVGRQLGNDEKKVMAELKREVKQNGKTEKAKMLAQRLVKIRSGMSKIDKMKGSMENVATDIKLQAANITMADSVVKATKVMKKVNEKTNVKKVMKNMQKYQQEMMKSEMTQEMIQDTLDEAFDEDDQDMEDELVNRVLDEVGLENIADMESAPMGKVSTKEAEADEDEERREIAALMDGDADDI